MLVNNTVLILKGIVYISLNHIMRGIIKCENIMKEAQPITSFTPYQTTIRNLSERIVRAQQPIRVLDAIKWDPSIQADFFKNRFTKLPAVTPEYYQQFPLPFDSEQKKIEFYDIERDIHRQLGQFSTVGNIMLRMCREYRELISMLEHRGKGEFSKLSLQLYGSSEDAFYAGQPSLKDLANMISATLANLRLQEQSFNDEATYSSEQMVAILQERMDVYFKESERRVTVKLSDGIIADSAAGADTIKVRTGATFTERDLKIMEVHEGWVHIGTTLNGLSQPICTFLSKGPPSSTVTQEGLAIIIEIFTFASYPGRVQRLTDRINAIAMAEQGGNFLDVFQFYRDRGIADEEAYHNTVRVFRGSTPENGPFTKDLVYSKGFVLIYTYIQLAVERGLTGNIPLLFTGKTTLEDVRSLNDLIEEGIVIPPKFIPPQFKDLAALSAWMCYSNFIRKLSGDRIAIDYKDVL